MTRMRLSNRFTPALAATIPTSERIASASAAAITMILMRMYIPFLGRFRPILDRTGGRSPNWRQPPMGEPATAAEVAATLLPQPGGFVIDTHPRRFASPLEAMVPYSPVGKSPGNSRRCDPLVTRRRLAGITNE